MFVVLLNFMVRKFKKTLPNISRLLSTDKTFCFWLEVLMKNSKRNLYFEHKCQIMMKVFPPTTQLALIKILDVLLMFYLGVTESNLLWLGCSDTYTRMLHCYKNQNGFILPVNVTPSVMLVLESSAVLM